MDKLTNEEQAAIVAKAYDWCYHTAEVDGFSGHEFDEAEGFTSMRKFYEDDLVEVDMRRCPFYSATYMVTGKSCMIWSIKGFDIYAGKELDGKSGFVIQDCSTKLCYGYTGDPSTLIIPSLSYEEMEAEVEAEVDTINPAHEAPARSFVNPDGRIVFDV